MLAPHFLPMRAAVGAGGALPRGRAHCRLRPARRSRRPGAPTRGRGRERRGKQRRQLGGWRARRVPHWETDRGNTGSFVDSVLPEQSLRGRLGWPAHALHAHARTHAQSRTPPAPPPIPAHTVTRTVTFPIPQCNPFVLLHLIPPDDPFAEPPSPASPADKSVPAGQPAGGGSGSGGIAASSEACAPSPAAAGKARQSHTHTR